MPKRYCNVCDVDTENFDICEDCNNPVCQKCMADGLQVLCRPCVLTELTQLTESFGGYTKELEVEPQGAEQDSTETTE